MKKYKSFTLIELLIVIALLGSLAVGLLAALDPFEQLKKGTDTGIRNTVSELHGAIIRYYAIRNYMPWCSNSQTCTNPNKATALSLENTVINNIIQTGELKPNFVELAGGQLGNIYITGTNDPPVVAVCYKPVSKSFTSNPNTKYNQDGTLSTIGCPTGNPNDNCYYCVK